MARGSEPRRPPRPRPLERPALRLRQRFDKSLEVDGVARVQNVEMIVGHADEYSEEENRMLTEGGKLFEDFEGTKTKSLKMASILTTAKIAYKSGDQRAWGWAATIVRARPEEVLAFMLDLNRRSARQDDDAEEGDPGALRAGEPHDQCAGEAVRCVARPPGFAGIFWHLCG